MAKLFKITCTETRLTLEESDAGVGSSCWWQGQGDDILGHGLVMADVGFFPPWTYQEGNT